MAINKKLIHFNRKEVFEEKLANNEILDTSIVFIKDSKEIWTHGQLYGGGSMVNITYADLVELRDNACLIPGMQYRITDYVTTTSQENTQSAGHQFDIIVTADSENTLNEKARAIQHEGDTYFSDSNLAAWEIWYSLDNDTERFAWADNTIQNWKAEILGRYVDDPNPNNGTSYSMDEDSAIYEWTYELHPDTDEETIVFYAQNPEYFDDEIGPDYTDAYFYNGIVTIDGTEYDSWKKYDYENEAWINSETGGLYALTKRMVYDNTVIWPETNVTNAHNGKGVIYYMKDEFGNECPYDFKNIQFLRRLSFKNGYAEFSDDGDVIWVYTFAGQSYHINNDSYSDMLDGSLESPFSHMSYGELSTFHDNIIKPYIIADNDNDLYSKCGVRYLNHNVLLGWWQEIGSGNEEETLFYYAHCCYSNNFGNNSFGNSLSNDCYDNNFGNNCINNKLYHGCHSNNFGNNCGYNILSIDCNSNSFGNACNNNYFYDDVNTNIFGDGCVYNKLYRQCSANRFSNFNSYNTLGDSCNYNSFENRCNNNSFGHDCCCNAFRDECHNNSFGDECNNNSFGHDCYDNSFGDKCAKNSFGNSCFRNSFGNNCFHNSFGGFYYGNSFGNNCDYNSFGNVCLGNSFGNDCCRNSFGNDYMHNSFGNNCCYNSFGNNCIYNSFRLSASTTTSLLDYCWYNHFDDGCSYNVIWNDVQPTSSNMLQNINVVRGVSGNSNEYNYINITDTDKDYEIKVAKNSKGEIKIYCEADLIA